MNVPNPMDKGAGDQPDYMGAVREQTAANRPNQKTPWATSRWTQSPSGPSDAELEQALSHAPDSMRGEMLAKLQSRRPQQWSQEISLDPRLQGANDSMMSQLGDAWSTPLDSGMGARDRAEGALYGRATSRLDPMWQQREHDFSTTLANQGIDPSSEAFAKARGNFDRGRNDAYTSALQESIMGGGAEGERTQRMDLQRRMAPLGAMSGLRDLSGMPAVPGAGNSLQAAALQDQSNQARAQYGRDFWKDLIQGGARAIAAGG